MMRIGVIGNSHTAALGQGWRDLAEECGDQSLTFFAAPRDGMRSLRSEGTCLVADDQKAAQMIAMSSGGDGRIDLAAFDEIWLVGLRLGIRPVMNTYERFFTDRMTADLNRIGLSTAAFTAAVAGNLSRSPMLEVAALIKTVTKTPLRVIPEPLPAKFVEESAERGKPWRLARRNGDEQELLNIYKSVSAEVVRPVGTLTAQPAETVSDDGFHTRKEFADSPARLGQHKDNAPDGFHMNAAYGRLLISECLANPLCGADLEEAAAS